jgi:flagellar biosynthesis/type III secretory pathway M-ring protein FliF/YscJ
MDIWSGIIWALAPTVIVTALFFFILRAAVRSDRSERKAYAKAEAEERARRGLPPKTPTTTA